MSDSAPGTSVSRTKKQRKSKRKKRLPIIVPPRPPAEQTYLFDELKPRTVIVPRPDHCVSRGDMDREALKVLYRLKDRGFIAYLVGGSVRDLLLGRRPKDFDIGTNAKPREIRKLFRYSRVIGRRFRIVHIYFRGGKLIEVSTFRQRTEFDDYEAAREGISEEDIFGTPRDDAFRRDLTINGLFYNIADFSIIDYVGGMADLRDGIIRTIGNPERRILRDPVRMMRAIRHAARTGFVIEPRTWEAIVRNAGTIRLCAVPRVRDEWLKDIRSGSSRDWARLMLESGLFVSAFPGFASVFSGAQADDVKDMLLSLLGQLDRLVNEGVKLSDPFMLALFLYPRLHVMPEWHALASERLRWPTHEVRAMIHELLAPYDFKRSDRDSVAQILASQWPIRTCLDRGSWPKRVWTKTTYPDAVRLYDCVQQSQGLPAIGPEPHLKYVRKKKPRGGRSRRKRGAYRNRKKTH